MFFGHKPPTDKDYEVFARQQRRDAHEAEWRGFLAHERDVRTYKTRHVIAQRDEGERMREARRRNMKAKGDAAWLRAQEHEATQIDRAKDQWEKWQRRTGWQAGTLQPAPQPCRRPTRAPVATELFSVDDWDGTSSVALPPLAMGSKASAATATAPPNQAITSARPPDDVSRSSYSMSRPEFRTFKARVPPVPRRPVSVSELSEDDQNRFIDRKEQRRKARIMRAARLAAGVDHFEASSELARFEQNYKLLEERGELKEEEETQTKPTTEVTDDGGQVCVHRRTDKEDEPELPYEAVVKVGRDTSLRTVEWNVPVTMSAEQFAKRQLGAKTSAFQNQSCCLGYDGRGTRIYMKGCERSGTNSAGVGPVYGSANIAAAAFARENAVKALHGAIGAN